MISALIFMMAALSGCKTSLEGNPTAAHSSAQVASAATSAPAPAPAPAPTSAPSELPSAVSQKNSSGIFGIYGGNLESIDRFADEFYGTQGFSVSVQPAGSKFDPRTVASMRLISNGDFFQDVDFEAPLDVRLNGARQADGSVRYEFFTDCAVIPHLTATRVQIELVLVLNGDGSNTVDSSQSLMNILDCGFSGNAGFARSYEWIDISEFGKR